MALANVTLTNTFDEWRTRTNQLIAVYEETNTLSVASFNKANSVTQDAANVTANLLSSNATIVTIINDTANTLVSDYINVIYDIANTSNFQSVNAESNSVIALSTSANAESNAALALSSSIIAFDQSNLALTIANTANLTANIAIVAATDANNTVTTFTANVTNTVAEILASNTFIQNTINTTAETIVNAYIANTPITAAFDTANTALLNSIALAIALG